VSEIYNAMWAVKVERVRRSMRVTGHASGGKKGQVEKNSGEKSRGRES
jgi:hypothetical protein